MKCTQCKRKAHKRWTTCLKHKNAGHPREFETKEQERRFFKTAAERKWPCAQKQAIH